MPNCTSHYIVVAKKTLKSNLCSTKEDFLLEGVTNYFPVEQGEQAEGDEIVVFSTDQVLPRYIVHYTVQPVSNFISFCLDKLH